MQCIKCRATYAPGAKFCSVCGTPMTPTTSSYVPVTSTKHDTADDATLSPYYEELPFIDVALAEATPAYVSYEAASVALPSHSTHEPIQVSSVPDSVPLTHQPTKKRGAKKVIVLLTVLVLLAAVGGTLAAYATNVMHARQPVLETKQTLRTVQASLDNNPLALYTKATSGTPILNDPLTNGDMSSWSYGSDDHTDGNCIFSDGAFHVTAIKSDYGFVCFTGQSLHNFAFQVQMTIINGDAEGILFRADTKKQQDYYLHIGGDGSYLVITDINDTYNMLQQGHLSAFNTAMHQPNLVTIIAQENRFYLYVNKQFVAKITDPENTYKYGTIGLLAADDGHSTDVAFNNAQLWDLT